MKNAVAAKHDIGEYSRIRLKVGIPIPNFCTFREIDYRLRLIQNFSRALGRGAPSKKLNAPFLNFYLLLLFSQVLSSLASLLTCEPMQEANHLLIHSRKTPPVFSTIPGRRTVFLIKLWKRRLGPRIRSTINWFFHSKHGKIKTQLSDWVFSTLQ
jgi:hypothetical protein